MRFGLEESYMKGRISCIHIYRSVVEIPILRSLTQNSEYIHKISKIWILDLVMAENYEIFTLNLESTTSMNSEFSSSRFFFVSSQEWRVVANANVNCKYCLR